MLNSWQPIRPLHSIECVATVVAFAEPLSEFLIKRVIRKAESVALNAGLSERADIRTFQFPAIPEAGHQVRSQFDGLAFQRFGQTTPQGRVLLEDLVVSRNELAFRKYDYNRWADYRADLNKLVLPLVDISSEATAVQALRLEYLDRFFIENYAPGHVSELLSRNPMVAPHVFETASLWHSHTGKFDPLGDDTLLTQINVDLVNNESAPDQPKLLHSVGIMTGLERRYDVNKLDVESPVVPYIDEHLHDLHLRSKALFESLLTPEIAARVGLGDNNVN
ncbi:hypothetical protein B5K08_21770 [Rhizobium leguminosarum bv. trifolii]|uniref:TIGR04255 family protein n=1 Tax=Rhizobium leguminosarum bv. trifolii TaxID=386 RepID=A0A3E1B9E2_RHILT|nr:TIGR04255 family protein [Rhizobium leguminosarum]RFB87909.1 hypothetical protein B5K08_21770 [Rhizobium leguminosarum bv. trifolii]RFB88150.1 hypothetical protein B5K10_21765 [Rhizobium leguminosarum bv. trifolii]